MSMTDNVVLLTLKEAPLVQQDAITILQESLGVESGREVIERAVFEISDRLCRLELALCDSELEVVDKLSASMVAMSSQIGLVVFAQVAQGLSHVIQENDYVAAAALSGRLLRLGESSLFCAVELANLSG